jgi:signal transduction histidine kinase
MLYFALLVVYTAMETGQGFTASQIQSYLNFGTNLILFGYLSWPWLQRKLKRWYLPIALAAATVGPVFSNLIYLADPRADDLSRTIFRSWVLLPILVVPLVLLAWQYRFRYVLAFITLTTIVEISVLLPQIKVINIETLPILGVPLIRAFAFGTMGHIVAHLTKNQRDQRKELLRVNLRLRQHAQTLEDLATSRERNRLARELHDTLAHTLSGQAVNLEAIKLTLPTDNLEVHAMLDHSLENTRAGLAETRRALKDLRAKPLDDLGLTYAIRNLALDAASRAGFDIVFDISNNLPELPPDVEQCFFRIAQESLENIVNHANANTVELHLEEINRRIILSIKDDGSGFNQAERNYSHKHGIRGMQERASMINANFQINSDLQSGTEVELSIDGLNE